MTGAGTAGSIARETIVRDLAQIVSDIIQDWDLDFSGGIREDTRLVGDLGFQSIDVVMLIGEIHRHYGRRDLPFERLLVRDGGYAGEIRIGEVADFLAENLDAAAAGRDGR